MAFRSFSSRFVAALIVPGFMLAVTGCQSNDGGIAGVGGSTTAPPPPVDKVKQSDLTGYCPKVSLRDGTAYFNTYGKAPKAKTAAAGDDAAASDTTQQNDSGSIIYQAAITDVTRDCTHSNGSLIMNVAVAGKVVPGPLGKAGTITMPIRVVVAQGDKVLYSQLHQYQVRITDLSAATQFVYKENNVTVPDASPYQVFVGYDEGPAKPKAAETKVHKRPRKPKKPKPAEAAAPPASGESTHLSDIPRD
jgi:hypothetical protein